MIVNHRSSIEGLILLATGPCVKAVRNSKERKSSRRILWNISQGVKNGMDEQREIQNAKIKM